MTLDKHHARLTTFDGVELNWLDGGTVTADRGWTPHVQARIPIAPPSVAVTNGTRVTLELSQRFGSLALTSDLTDLYAGDTTANLTTAFAGDTTADLTALIAAGSWNTTTKAATGRKFDLMVTKITKRRDSWTLELASCEALYIDALNGGLVGSPDTVVLEGDTTPAMVRFFHSLGILASWADSLAYTDLTFPALVVRGRNAGLAAQLSIDKASNYWSAVIAALVSVGQRLYSRGDWAMILAEENVDAVASINVSDGVNLIDWELNEELTGATLVRWAGTAADPDARPVYSSDTGVMFRPWTRLVDVPQPLVGWPRIGEIGTPWDTPATPYVDRAGLDLSPLKLVTINDYSVMPWDDITYTLPDEDETTSIIDAITWQLGGRWEMDIWV